MTLSLLHTGDFHGKLDQARVDALKPLRAKADFYFDCGDGVDVGNLGIPTKPDPVWRLLAELNCTASVPGNRESHLLSSVYHKKTGDATHPILCANLVDKGGNPVHLSSITIGRVGVLGVMVPMVTKRMASRVVSDFLWLDPIKAASEVVAKLRPQVEVLIALTHIGYPQDRLLVAECPGIDILLGGHSHTVLEVPERQGDTWIAHTGSHGRYAGLYSYDLERRVLDGRLHSLSANG